jgi:hypothetical protein
MTVLDFFQPLVLNAKIAAVTALSEETACCVDGVEVAYWNEPKMPISLLQGIT